jgi:hypothetical protein
MGLGQHAIGNDCRRRGCASCCGSLVLGPEAEGEIHVCIYIELSWMS